jgi:hypothetical protein
MKKILSEDTTIFCHRKIFSSGNFVMVVLLNDRGGFFFHTGRTKELLGEENINIYFQKRAGIVRLMNLLTLKPVLSHY